MTTEEALAGVAAKLQWTHPEETARSLRLHIDADEEVLAWLSTSFAGQPAGAAVLLTSTRIAVVQHVRRGDRLRVNASSIALDRLRAVWTTMDLDRSDETSLFSNDWLVPGQPSAENERRGALVLNFAGAVFGDPLREPLERGDFQIVAIAKHWPTPEAEQFLAALRKLRR